MEKKDVTILVNSCDKYEDAWEPFFKLLKLQWYDCSYDIVLSTETKSYFCDYLNVKVVNSPKDMPWSNRLKYTLSQIDTEYVLFFLEDFFLLEKVDVCCFEKALKIMNENKEISLIQFPSVEPHYKPPEIISDNTFVNVKLFKSYRAKVMVSLWRKKDFEKVIFDNENPWVCEKETSIRTITCGQKILRQDNNISVPTFYYCINPRMGYGITNGKWLKNNKSFFESYGIHNVNYDNLGIELCAKTYKQIELENKKKREETIESVLREGNLFNRIKELIYMFKRRIYKSLNLDLLISVLKYRKIYKDKQ